MLIFDKQRESYQIVGYKQFDSLEPLRATFLNNGQPISLIDYYVRFECKKPDGNIVIDDENINIRNVCEIEMLLNEQVAVVNGNVKCQFVLVRKNDERQTSTFDFEMNIQQSVIAINGYSHSTITIAERLNKDIPIAKKLHEDLTKDIADGNKTKQELIEKTTIAKTTINTLVEKTAEGNNTIDGLVEKDAIAKATDSKLNKTIDNANETNRILNESNSEADTTNARLQMTIDSGKDSIDKINATGNKSLIIGASQFINNEYTWKHDMNSEDLHVTFEDLATKLPLLPDYQRIDKNNILIRNSAESPNIKVVLSASYYQGNALFGTNVEEFASDSIGVNTKKVRLKDGNGIVENPVTDSDAVFMPDGTTKLTKKIDDISASLEQKAQKTEVRMKNTLIAMSDIGQDVKTAMTNGSVAVVGVDGISNVNILNEGIKPVNVSFMETSRNLYNPVDIYVGTVSNTNGSFVSGDTGYRRTGYIKITPNTKYKFVMFSGSNVSYRYAWYDSNYIFISGNTGDISVSNSPSNAKFVVVCFSNDNYNNYSRYFFGLFEEEFCMFDNSEIKKEYISDNEKIVKKGSKNLFNHKTVKTNYLIDVNGNTQAKTYGEILSLNTTNNSYWQSDLIQVDYGKTYSAWYGASGSTLSLFRITYWDKNKRLIKFESSINKFTINNKNIKYVAIANSNGYTPKNCMISEGETFSGFLEFKELITLNDFNLIDESVFDWYGKKICTYGDSITQYGFWQKAVLNYHKFSKHYLRGLSGSKVSSVDAKDWWINSDGSAYGTKVSYPTQPSGTTLIKDYFSNLDRINTVPSDSDIVLIMGGTNDFYSNIPLGNLEYNNGYDETTFKGALASTIMKMQNRVPNAVIVLMTLINGQGETNVNGNSMKVNTIGLKAVDYANAIKEVAYYLGIPCIDIFGKAGINSWNRNQYIGTDAIHPTYNILNSGADQIARVIIGELKNIIPKFSSVIYDPNN